MAIIPIKNILCKQKSIYPHIIHSKEPWRIGNEFICLVCGKKSVLGIGCSMLYNESKQYIREAGPACKECTEKMNEERHEAFVDSDTLAESGLNGLQSAT